MTDNLTKEQRSYCMSRVKDKDTGIERLVRSELHKRGLRFRKHVASLPGKPDIVFKKARVAVFIDGDFWHGFRFPAWRNQLSAFWQKKIAETRKRDQSNFRKLRRMDWRVIRIWEHQLDEDVSTCIERIESAVVESSGASAHTHWPIGN